MEDILALDRAYRRLRSYVDGLEPPLARAMTVARFQDELPESIQGRSFYDLELAQCFLQAIERVETAPVDPVWSSALQRAVRSFSFCVSNEPGLRQRLDLVEARLSRRPDPPRDARVARAQGLSIEIAIPVAQEIPSFLHPEASPLHLGQIVRFFVVPRPYRAEQRHDHWVIHGAREDFPASDNLEDVSAQALIAGLEGARAFLRGSQLESTGGRSGRWFRGRVSKWTGRGRAPRVDSATQSEAVAARLSWDLTVQDAGLLVAGGSAGLALAVTFASVIAGLCRFRPSIPSPRYAWTGAIRPTGEVDPVSPASLHAKVRAAAFAGMDGIVVPGAQLEDACRAVPAEAGQLAVFPADHVGTILGHSKLFGDAPALAELMAAGSGRGTRRRRSALLAGAALTGGVAALAIWQSPLGARLVRPPLARVDLQIERSSYIVRGWTSDGRRLWQHSEREQVESPVDVVGRPHEFAISGTTSHPRSVLFATRPAGGNAHAILLRASDGRPLWNRELSARLAIRANLGRWISPWQSAVKWPGYAEPVFAVGLFEDKWAPACLQILDSRGVILGEYYNPGHLYLHAQADLDRDGIGELILYGYNNSAGHLESVLPFALEGINPGAIMVLRPSEIAGQAYPYRAWDQVPPARESAYLIVLPLAPDLASTLVDCDIGFPDRDGPARLDLALEDGRILSVGPDLLPRACALPAGSAAQRIQKGGSETYRVIHLRYGVADTLDLPF